jgi:hypothetical protein
MSFANEAARSLASALGIMRYEPSALQGFNLSIEGFWRSFAAVFVILPMSWIMMAGADKAVATLGGTEVHSRLYQSSMFVVAFVIVWPVVVALIARGFNLGNHYLRYMIAYNWLSIPLAGLVLIPDLLFLAGIAGLFMREAMGLLAYGVALYYCWYLARIAFETNGFIAFAFVAADFGVSLALSYLVSL